jgi:hypothetical protein
MHVLIRLSTGGILRTHGPFSCMGMFIEDRPVAVSLDHIVTDHNEVSIILAVDTVIVCVFREVD